MFTFTMKITKSSTFFNLLVKTFIVTLDLIYLPIVWIIEKDFSSAEFTQFFHFTQILNPIQLCGRVGIISLHVIKFLV